MEWHASEGLIVIETQPNIYDYDILYEIETFDYDFILVHKYLGFDYFYNGCNNLRLSFYFE